MQTDKKIGVNKYLRIGINWKSKEKLAIYENNNVAKTYCRKVSKSIKRVWLGYLRINGILLP